MPPYVKAKNRKKGGQLLLARINIDYERDISYSF